MPLGIRPRRRGELDGHGNPCARRPRLERSVGFHVESPHGEIGSVEEIWLDPDGEEPRALAIRTPEGRHGLILANEVAAVDAEQEWVVVGPEATLLELEPPRLAVDSGTKARRLLAVWETSGSTLPEPPPRALPFPLRLLHPHSRAAEPRAEQEHLDGDSDQGATVPPERRHLDRVLFA